MSAWFQKLCNKQGEAKLPTVVPTDILRYKIESIECEIHML